MSFSVSFLNSSFWNSASFIVYPPLNVLFLYIFASLFSFYIIPAFCRRILLHLFLVVIQYIISIIFRLLRLFSNSAQGVQLFIYPNVSCYLQKHYFIRLSIYPDILFFSWSFYSHWSILRPSWLCMVHYLCTLLTSIFFSFFLFCLFHSQLISFVFFLSPFFLV